jgi:hypothetical protein
MTPEKPRVYEVDARVTIKGYQTNEDAVVIGRSIAGTTKVRTSSGVEMLVSTRILRPRS